MKKVLLNAILLAIPVLLSQQAMATTLVFDELSLCSHSETLQLPGHKLRINNAQTTTLFNEENKKVEVRLNNYIYKTDSNEYTVNYTIDNNGDQYGWLYFTPENSNAPKVACRLYSNPVIQ